MMDVPLPMSIRVAAFVLAAIPFGLVGVIELGDRHKQKAATGALSSTSKETGDKGQQTL